MLTITALRITEDGDFSGYDVHVYVCSKEIWHGTVKDHKRSRGWEALLRAIAWDAQNSEKQEDIDHGEECPVCKSTLGRWVKR